MSQPSQTEWEAVTKGTFVNVGGGLAMIGVKSLGLVLRAIFGGVAYGLFITAYKIIEQITYLLLGGFVDSIVLYAARYLPRSADTALPDPSDPIVRGPVLPSDAEVAALSDAEREERLYRALATAIGVPVVLGLLAALALQALAPWLHATVWKQHPVLIVTMVQRLSWALPLLVLMQLPAEAIKAHLKWGWPVAIVQVVFPTLTLVGALASQWLFDRGILALADGVLLGFAVCVPLSLFAFAQSFSLSKLLRAMLRFQIDREVVGFALPQGLNMALNQGLVNVDVIVLSGVVSANTLGVYSNVVDMTQMIRVAKLALSGVYSPLAARLNAAGNRVALENAMQRMGTMTALLSLPVLLVVMTIYPGLVISSKEPWTWPAVFPWLLAIGPMMSCFFGLAGNTLLMVGRPKLLLANSAAAGTLNVVLNLVLVPLAGVLGAAVATATSNATISLLQLVELARLERLRFHAAMYARTLAAGALPVAAVAFLAEPTGRMLTSFTGWPDALPVRIGVAAAAVTVFAILYAVLPGPSALAVWRGTAPPVPERTSAPA